VADYLVSLKADVSQAKKDIEGVKGSVDGLVTAAKAFAVAFIGSKFVGFLQDAVAEATAAEDALNELKGAFIGSGIEAESAAASFKIFAAEMQRTTKYGDDQVISLAAQLQAMGNFTEQGLKVATKAALDFAAFYKKDVATAIQLVGKAANGEVGSLSKLGIKVKEGATNAETFANFLEKIAKSSGAAEREVLTFSGAMAQLQNNASDVLESIGNVIINNDALKGSIQLATRVFIDLQAIVEKNADSIGVVLSGAIDFLLVGLRAVLNVLVESVKGWRLFINAGQQAFAGLVGYAAEFLSYILEIGKFIPGLSDKVEGLQLFLDDVAKGQGKVVDDLKDSADKLLDTGMVSATGGESPMAKSFRDAAKATGPLVQNVVTTAKGADEAKKQLEKMNTALTNGSKDISSFVVNIKEISKASASQQGGALASAVTQSLVKGAAGASAAISGTLGAVANSFLPGIGGAVTALVDLFAQGPEKVRETINAFAAAIPQVLSNIILSLPVFIQAIVDNIPMIIDALIASIPFLIEALVQALPQLIVSLTMLMPKIAYAFTVGLIKMLPMLFNELIAGIPDIVTQFINQFVAGIPTIVNQFIEFIKSAIPGGGTAVKAATGDVGGVISDIGNFFGFAEGGMVPAGYPNDSFPAKLTSGEAILPTDTVAKLDSFLSNGGGAGQNVTVNLVVGEEQLAKVILNLNRQGFRLN
jgi:hypothetical protein